MNLKSAASLVLTGGLAFLGSVAIAQQQGSQEQERIETITGLDGATYEAYKPSVVEQVQTALKSAGFYAGEVDGVLDQETMEAIAKYQKEHGIQASGVPSPETREALGIEE